MILTVIGCILWIALICTMVVVYNKGKRAALNNNKLRRRIMEKIIKEEYLKLDNKI